MIKLTNKQQMLFNFILDFQRTNNRRPNIKEMATPFNLTEGGILARLSPMLEKKKCLRRTEEAYVVRT